MARTAIIALWPVGTWPLGRTVTLLRDGAHGFNQKSVTFLGGIQNFDKNTRQRGIAAKNADGFTLVRVRQGGDHDEIILFEGQFDLGPLWVEGLLLDPDVAHELGCVHAGVAQLPGMAVLKNVVYQFLHRCKLNDH